MKTENGYGSGKTVMVVGMDLKACDTML
ncbi:hypothetical protein A2U01_0068366, partial [Trifolium medium]|nr:hypothetical protein [Trifolium medium]